MKRRIALLLLAAAPALATDPGSVYDLGATWTSQDDRPVPLASLAGKPRVVAMFFSRCGYACPRITQELKNIDAALTPAERARVGFVMASFDAEYDTPDALRAFAAAKELDLSRWLLLHGSEDDVRDLAAVLHIRYRRDPEEGIAHSNMITVLDAAGRMIHQHEGLGGDLSDITAAIRNTLAATD